MSFWRSLLAPVGLMITKDQEAFFVQGQQNIKNEKVSLQDKLNGIKEDLKYANQHSQDCYTAEMFIEHTPLLLSTIDQLYVVLKIADNLLRTLPVHDEDQELIKTIRDALNTGYPPDEK